MRKRNSPIRMIAVHPAPLPRRHMVWSLAQRFGVGLGPRYVADRASALPGGSEASLDSLDLDQRVRASGEW
ncbi:MAG: short-chain dehydrogenase [Pseudomonadota bacterium]|uniref:short-chain dehydrogenase n=1 Tax=Variovorax boronicumulans TaxID=436515 RepID=UPI000FAB030C|nr:short-chain dehydrogenase [Variovorax boronicumulans]MDP9910757.1 hypothetical protein [Variovorax boronicumulans]